MARFNKTLAKRIAEEVIPHVLEHYNVSLKDCSFSSRAEDEDEAKTPLEEMPWIKGAEDDSGISGLVVEFNSPKHPTMICRVFFWATGDGWVAVEGWLSPSARKKVTTQLLHMSIPQHPCCDRCASNWWKNFYSTKNFEEAIIHYLELYFKLGSIINFKHYDVDKH
jgi:hypothetical protein